MNRRQKIIVSVTGIFIVLLILVGITYAYFLTRINGNTETKSISVTTADLKLVYGDGNGVISNINALMPGVAIEFEDADGNPVESKIFTVANEGNKEASYVAVIEDVSVTWTTSGTTTDDDGNTVAYNAGDATKFETNDFTYTLDCKIYTKDEYDKYKIDPTTATSTGSCNGTTEETIFPINGGIIVENSIDENFVHVYEYKMKYNDSGEDQSNDMNKTMTAKINIADPKEFNPYSNNTATLAYNIINNAITLTSEEKTAGYAEFATLPITTPAVSISSENESVLSTTLDDLGTSYYFRGNVTNNYVEFNNMCWRIVRIEGDGSVKITLAAQKACAEITEEDTESAFIGDAIYGFSSSQINGSEVRNYTILNYDLGSHENSAIKVYKQWFEGTLDDGTTLRFSELNKTKLKTRTMCIEDTSVLYDPNTYESVAKEILFNEEITSGKLNYGLANKLSQKQLSNLKCGNNSTQTNSGQIFPLSAEEVVFAGITSGEGNPNIYLTNNTTGIWLLITPAYFYKKTETDGSVQYLERIYSLRAEGSFSYQAPTVNLHLRPATSLIAGIEISGGNGDKNTPYIVK